MLQEEKARRPDWTDLPREILDVILGKLVHLYDYVRFGAVCKSWHSVAIDQKQRRIATLAKQPPMLLFKRPQKDIHDDEYFKLGKINLYSIGEDKFYKNHGLESRQGVVCLGSSYGWLILCSKLAFEQGQRKKGEDDEDEDSGSKNLRNRSILSLSSSSITLLNPVTQKSIQMPGMGDSGKIRKAILSCDPSTSPDDFFLAALSEELIGVVALIRAGGKFWKLALNHDRYTYDCGVRDITFHKGLLYALDDNNRLTTIDHHDDGRFQVQTRALFWKRRHYQLSFLVEASNGDLLLVLKKKSNLGFRVYKRVATKKKAMPNSLPGTEEFGWVKIRELENKDAIFVSDNTSFCISAASWYPNCIPNSIHFTPNLMDKRFWKFGARSDSEIGIFHIGDGTFSALDGLPNSHKILPRAWISSTLL